MKTYVKVSGCDDETSAVVDLTPKQAEGIRLVSDAINANSSSGCQPTMQVRVATAEDIAAHDEEHAND